MREHKTVLSLTLALLLATLAFSQAQKQVQVLVASDRTATIRLQETDGKDGLSGDLEASADLAEGSSAIRADLTLEDAEELADGTAGAFMRTSGDTIETIGQADLPMPVADDDGEGPDRLDFTFESATADGGWYTSSELQAVAPADEPVPSVALNGSVEGSPDSVSGALDYSVTLSEAQARQIPVTDLSLSLADETTGSGDGEAVTTTLTLSVTAPKGSQAEPQLRSASQAQPLIEQQLRQVGVQVEQIDVPPVEETDDAVTANATVVVRDLRRSLGGFIDMAGPAMAQDPAVDPQVMTASLKKMLDTRIDSLNLTLNVDGREVSGELSGQASRLREFFAGYMDMVRMAVRRSEIAPEDSVPGDSVPADSVPDEVSTYARAFQEANLEQSARSLEALMESDVSFAGQGEFSLGGDDGTTTLEGAFDLSVDGYRDFAEKARAAGSPVPDTALVTAELHLTDAGRLEGEYYGYSDGDLLRYYKNIVLQTLAEAGGAEEASSLVEEAELEEAAFSLDLENRELTVRGYSRTTPLTEAGRALLEELRPELDATPEGAHVDYVFRPDGTGEGEISFYFSDFMPDASAAQIREALGLPDTADVQTDVSPEAVTRTRVDRPEVEPSTELADIRSAAQSVAGRRPGDGDGIPTWVWIAAGVLLLAVLVGVGLTGGRRRRTA